MSGFAIVIQPDSPAQERDGVFQSFLQLVAEYKRLDLPAETVVGKHCTAAKLDSPSSLHRGITRDERTGSWLFAAGTLVDVTGKSSSDPGLGTLLRDYVENGEAALQRYDGHFALVVYNKREESLCVISDPFGLFSIFCGSQGDQTFISTSALAVARQIRSRPDTLAIECFLRTGRAYGDKTLWQDVRRIPPATILKITQGKVEESEYWAPAIDETIASLSFNEALAQAIDVLSHTFKRLLQREGRVWADLTGGFDTRLTTVLMAKLGIPFIAYCVGPADHPDVQISRLISHEMGWEYRYMPLPYNWEQEQCAWFETALHKGDARLNVLQLAGVLWGHQQRSITSKAHVLGVGGEHWRGLSYWRGNLFNLGRSSSVNYDYLLDSKILSSIPISTLCKDRSKKVRHELRGYLEQLPSRYAEFPNTFKLDVIFMKHRHTIHGGAYLSATAGIMRSLIPFCLKEPTTFAFSLNYKWKLPDHQRFARALLEKESKRLASIMTTSGGPASPMRVTNIHRFWPLWKPTVNRATRKFSRKLLGKPVTIWPEKSNYAEYPLPTWRKAWLSFATAEGLLKPCAMHSGVLYNADELQALVSQSGTEGFRYGEFLDRIITVEMALRTVGTSVG
jgi:hypothetical protein